MKIVQKIDPFSYNYYSVWDSFYNSCVSEDHRMYYEMESNFGFRLASLCDCFDEFEMDLMDYDVSTGITLYSL